MPRTALITGSTSGIGLGMAKAFAAKGHNVIFNGLEKDGAEIAAQVAQEHGIRHIFSPANLMDEAAIKSLAEEALRTFGTVDILVNNAGIQHVAPIEEFTSEQWHSIISVNLSAAFFMTQALWPAMKAQNFGRVINISSAHGLVASAFKSAYVASKHGLHGLTKTLAIEGAPFGITVNAICPGYVHTPIIDAQIPDQMKAHHMSREQVIQDVLLAKQPIKAFIPIEAIASAALYLAADETATTTGIALPVDGGWTAE